MSRLRILEKIALITAPVMHSTDAASRRQTSTPNAVPETRTRVDASVASAFLADMDIGAARSGERASGAARSGGSVVRSGERAMATEAQCGRRRSVMMSHLQHRITISSPPTGWWSALSAVCWCWGLPGRFPAAPRNRAMEPAPTRRGGRDVAAANTARPALAAAAAGLRPPPRRRPGWAAAGRRTPWRARAAPPPPRALVAADAFVSSTRTYSARSARPRRPASLGALKLQAR